MGSIARSLQRAGYLKPTVDSLYGYLQRRRYEQGLQQLAEMLSGSENRIEDIYTGTKEEKTVTPTGRTTYPALGQLVGQDPVQRPETLLSSLANTQPKPLMRLNPVTKNYEEEKVVGVPETITETKQIPRYTPQEQNRLAGQEINSFLRRLITSQDIPMERGQVGLSALQQLANTYKPEKREFMNVPEGGVIIDQYGNKVFENVKDFQGNIPSHYDTIKTFNVNGKPIMKGLVKGTANTWEELGEEYYKPNAGTTINIKPPEENKWKDFGDLVTEAQRTTYTAKIKGKDGKEIIKEMPMPPEKIKTAKNKLYNKALGNLTPSALLWYNTRIKGAWGRENMSEADYIAEFNEAIKNNELDSPEAAQSALDFGAYRRYMFELDDKDYKAKK